MARVSFRIPDSLRTHLEREADRCGMTLSDYCRTILSQQLTIVPPQWKVVLWNILGVDSRRATISLKKSATVEDFFAGILSHVRKGVKIKPVVLSDPYQVSMTFTIDEREYTITVNRETSIEATLHNMINKLEKAIMEGYDEEAEDI